MDLTLFCRTLQEYCNARELKVVTQPMAERDMQAAFESEQIKNMHPGAATADDEEFIFPAMRRWHNSRVDQCRPYWLDGFSNDNVGGKLREALDQYSTMTQLTVCKFPVDVVRAMYPMMFNTPCEDHEELMGLIQQVSDATANLSFDEMSLRSKIDLQVLLTDENTGMTTSVRRGSISGDVSFRRYRGSLSPPTLTPITSMNRRTSQRLEDM